MSVEDTIAAAVEAKLAPLQAELKRVNEQLATLLRSATNQGPTELLTVDDVAARCKVKATTARAWIRSGQLRATKAGRHYRIAPAALDRFLSGLSVAADNAPDPKREAARILGVGGSH